MRPWYVITGAPSSGKTTTLAVLAKRGYRVIPEVARVVIDEGRARGLTIEDLRLDEAKFQQDVLVRKQQIEASLSPDETILFDRGIPDTVAYCQLHRLDASLAQEAAKASSYRHVFIFDRLAFEPDYARIEDDAQVQQLDRLLAQAYRDGGFTVTRVPVGSVEERADMIESMLH
ncbi:MAG TPA: ATP-binding protein [Candidatus Saccharimonadales bacterium]|nr:ATP-binding protein [Candidatus Saccharimonadales bacterium]